jgi:hypothetical protein
VAVARDNREAGDLRVADEIINFAALVIRPAPVAVVDQRERAGGPLVFDQAVRKVLRIGTKIEGALRVAPDLPRGRRSAKLVQKPLLLIVSEDRVRR